MLFWGSVFRFITFLFMHRSLLGAVLLSILSLGSSSSFEIEPTTLQGTSVFYREIEIVSTSNTSKDKKKVTLHSHVSINQRFMTEAPMGTVEVVLLPKANFDKIQSLGNTYHSVCCDPDLKKMCSSVNHLILDNANRSALSYTETPFNGKSREIDQELAVTQSGHYYVVVASCDPRTHNIVVSGTVSTNGVFKWLLEGFSFYQAMTCVYVFLFSLWLLRCLVNGENVMQVHFLLTGVLALYLGQITLRLLAGYCTYMFGSIPLGVTLLSNLVCATALALSRFTLLAICKGLGVSKPVIGDDLGELTVVASVSFVVWLVCNHAFSGNLGRVLYGLLTLVDVGTVLVALHSLRRTIEDLEREKQPEKQRVLLRLRNVLLGIAGAWMGYNLLWERGHKNSLDWWMQNWFYRDGAPILFDTMVLVFIMMLWIPSENSLSYASHQQLEVEEGTAD